MVAVTSLTWNRDWGMTTSGAIGLCLVAPCRLRGCCTLVAVSVEQLAAIQEVHTLFQEGGVAYWLFGGWAVDFHAGRVTRSHADIDVAVWASDLERIRQLLNEARWRLVADQPTEGFLSFERTGTPMDVALLERDEDGVIYTPTTSGRGDWPGGSFGADVGILNGVVAHVISLGSLIADKSEPKGGSDSAVKDHADVAVLRLLG
jgi:hypothetical protein